VSASLLILCLAAFALVAVLVSGLVGATLPFLDRWSLRLAPRQRVRLWLGLAALPSVVAILAVLVSFLPALGIGHDHCLAHGPHHPHLCPHHVGGAPGVVLVFVVALLALRLVHVTVELVRGLRASGGTSRALAQVSDSHDGVVVFPSDQPQAFVLGVLRPRVHMSRGLLALGRDVVEPVLAHERVHARRRDLLWRALCPVFAAGHVPSVAASLQSRIAAAQEMAADLEAADSMPHGRIKLAEALVRLARLARPASTPSLGISFAHGNLEARVHALLDDRRGHPAWPAWPARALLLAGLFVPVAVAAAHDLIHHGLETLLGALS
jgi:hypothetical protein